jgi:predicted RNA-binding Zn ribbon-like protein
MADFGDRVIDEEPGAPQPGGRRSAPGELSLLQSFLNTHFDLSGTWGMDLLDEPDRLKRWLVNRELLSASARPPTIEEVGLVLAVREGLRALAEANHGAASRIGPSPRPAVTEALSTVCLGLGWGGAGLVLHARGDGVEGAMSGLLCVAATAMIDGRWERMKKCPGEDCGWVFFDRSRNNSGRWCSMSVCGGRAKARSYYRRRRTSSAG